MNKKNVWPQVWLLLIFVLFGFYVWQFIQRTSFILDNQLYYALLDDAMISMRYARNLVSGYGLVWNPGERPIEAFSSPVWVGMMAVVHALRFPTLQISSLVQIISGVILAINLLVVKMIGDEVRGNSHWVFTVFMVGLTAFYFPLNNWALQGTEVGLAALLLNGAVWGIVYYFHRARFATWPYLLLGLSTLVRLDMLILSAVILVFMAITDKAFRRAHLIWGLRFVLGFVAFQTIVRWLYFGDLIPNTFFLYTEYPIIPRVSVGLRNYLEFIWGINWVLFVIPFGVLLFAPRTSTNMLVTVFVMQSAYNILIGEDGWEHLGGANRLMAVVMPIFIVLFTLGLEQLRQQVVKIARVKGTWVEKAVAALMLPVLVISLVSFNNLNEADILRKWTLEKRPPLVSGTEHQVYLGYLAEQLTTPEARIAAALPGNIAYFSNRNTLGLLGSTDRQVARQPARQSGFVAANIDYRPERSKWNYALTIGEEKPDLVLQLWARPQDAAPYLETDYQKVYFEGVEMYALKQSPYIQWEKFEKR